MVTPYQQRLHEEHKARQARLQAAAYVPPPLPPPPPPKIKMPPPKKKLKPAAPPAAPLPPPAILNGTLETILHEVALKHGVDSGVITSRAGRDRMAVDARFEYFYRARVETGFSTMSIARLTGHDHTSVIHGARQHAARHRLPLPTRRYGGWRGPL